MFKPHQTMNIQNGGGSRPLAQSVLHKLKRLFLPRIFLLFFASVLVFSCVPQGTDFVVSIRDIVTRFTIYASGENYAIQINVNVPPNAENPDVEDILAMIEAAVKEKIPDIKEANLKEILDNARRAIQAAWADAQQRNDRNNEITVRISGSTSSGYPSGWIESPPGSGMWYPPSP